MKKKVAAAVLAAVLLMLAGLCFGNETREALSAGDADAAVVIDPGHGGADGGASSISGLKESDLNLKFALRLEQAAAFAGLKPVMTRSDDSHLGSSDFVKAHDIRARLAAAEENPGAILVSIHQNSYPDSRYGGAQVFYGRGEGSKALAEAIQQRLKAALDIDNDRQIKSGGDSIYILKNYQGVSVLAECGFLTNPEDEAALQTEQYQKKTAISITAALLSFIFQN